MNKTKLVRDRIPEIIDNSGRLAITKNIKDFNENDQKKYIKNKLKEEILEFQVSDNYTKQVEEMADVLEVIECFFDRDIVVKLKTNKLNPNHELYAITKIQIEIFELDIDDIIKSKNLKREKNGSFQKGIILMEIRE